MHLNYLKPKTQFILFCLSTVICFVVLGIFIAHVNELYPYTTENMNFYFSVLSAYTLWPLGTFCVAYSTTYLIKPKITLQCKNIILWVCIACFVLYYLCMILFTISNFTDINTFANRLIGNYFLRTHLMYNAKVYTMFLGFIIGLIVNTKRQDI